MHVYGEVAVFDTLHEAETYLGGLTWESPSISGWYGFYQERGEQVSAIGFRYGVADTYEYSGGIEDVKLIDETWIQTRWLGSFGILELADFESEDSWQDPERPPAPERGPSRGEPWDVLGWSYDLPSGTWYETPMPELSTWFLVTRYWGFAVRVGANEFHIYG